MCKHPPHFIPNNAPTQGDWKPKQIDNPDYQGEWVHPEIPNPDYEPDELLYRFEDFGSIGFDLWQVGWFGGYQPGSQRLLGTQIHFLYS